MSQEEVYELIAQEGIISIEEIEKMMEISERGIERALAKLFQFGEVKKIFICQTRFYITNELYNSLCKN